MAPPHIYQTEAIIIKKRNWKETDRLFTVYTPNLGKLRLKACGVRKITSRRAASLEIFNHLHLTIYRGTTMDTLVGVSRAGEAIISSLTLSQISYMYYLCELVDALTAERVKHPEVFTLLRDNLSLMRQTNESELWQTCLTRFALKLLSLLGFLPESEFAKIALDRYIEKIIERKLATASFLIKVNGGN